MKKALIILTASLCAFFLLQAGTPQTAKAQNLFTSIETADIYAAAFDSSVFGKRPTMLWLWAISSGVCVDEISVLEGIRREYAGRVNVIGVLLDAISPDGKSINGAALAAARDALEAVGATYPTIVASPELYRLMKDFGISAVPTTWFLDTGGTILYQAVGALGEEGYGRAVNDVLLEQPGPPGKDTEESPIPGAGFETTLYKTLMAGDRDPGVKRMRDRLYDLGYYQNRYDHNNYTQSMADIVKLFQQVNGLPADGVATPETQILLFSDRALPKP